MSKQAKDPKKIFRSNLIGISVSCSLSSEIQIPEGLSNIEKFHALEELRESVDLLSEYIDRCEAEFLRSASHD